MKKEEIKMIIGVVFVLICIALFVVSFSNSSNKFVNCMDESNDFWYCLNK